MSQSVLVADHQEPVAKSIISSRSASVDLLKVFCILSVVFVHGTQVIPCTMSRFQVAEFLAEALVKVFKLGVPIFVFFWAYFLERSILKRGNSILSTRFYKLLIPFGAWSLVYFLLLADFERLTPSSFVSKHWSGSGWAGQYYYIILFQLLLLFPIIRKCSYWATGRLPVFHAASLLFYCLLTYFGWFGIGIVGKLGEMPFVYWLPYVVLGIAYAHRNLFTFSRSLPVGVAAIVLILLESHASGRASHLLPSLYITSLLFIGFVMNAKLRYELLPNWLAQSVLKIARNTLGIFCLNPLVILCLQAVFAQSGERLQVPGGSIVVPLLVMGLVTALCLLLIRLLKRLQLGVLVAN